MTLRMRNQKKANWMGAALIALAVVSAVPGDSTADPVGKGAAVGAAGGALVSAIAGGNPLRGAAVGAATGAIVGAIKK